MQLVLDGPMGSDQREHACWRSLPHGKTAQSIHHLMPYVVGLEDAGGAFEPKDLLDALPVLAKPIIEIRTAGDMTMLESPMSLIPRLRLLPPTTIRGAIFKQIGNILMQRRLIVLGNQEIISLKPVDLRTEQALRMHGIQGEDVPFDQLRGQQGLERTDLILFLLHITVP